MGLYWTLTANKALCPLAKPQWGWTNIGERVVTVLYQTLPNACNEIAITWLISYLNAGASSPKVAKGWNLTSCGDGFIRCYRNQRGMPTSRNCWSRGWNRWREDCHHKHISSQCTIFFLRGDIRGKLTVTSRGSHCARACSWRGSEDAHVGCMHISSCWMQMQPWVVRLNSLSKVAT